MERHFPKATYLIVFSLLLLLQVAWNIYLYFLPSHTTWANYWFNVFYGSSSFITGVVVLAYVFRDRYGGQVVSALGYLGLAILVNGGGLYSWAYYNLIARVPVPHPSAAEAFFFVYPLLLTIGTVKLLWFYANRIHWRIIVEAVVVSLLAAIPIFYYYILPSFTTDSPLVTWFIVIGILLGNSLLVGVVYMVVRLGRGKIRGYMPLYVASFALLVAADFLFQYRAETNVYWNGDITDTLYLLHGYFFSLAAIETIDSHSRSSELSLVANIDENPFVSTEEDR